MLLQAYREDCFSRCQFYEWFRRFKSVRKTIKVDLRTGVLFFERFSHRVGIVQDLVIRKTDNLQPHRIAAKYLPCLVTDKENMNHVTASV
ncbi:hypothetical protein AVEN_104089-1 [Araneus ventricosus]|uniref:Mos1 transposase HTH domain-containing protein n=1 Tax=Araneus ventricosus TaxID=182803 RepID=A0A4Y2J967_ARAVE|nr:hypothetical protein AVEN_104089-1 [Araneus ventricosus]